MNYIISVFNPEAEEIFEQICKEISLSHTVMLHGHGTAVKSMLDLLGIESGDKRVALTIAGNTKVGQLINAQKSRMYLGVPGHGMTVAVPIKSIGGGKTLAYLNDEQASAKYTPTINYDYELIIAIANEGTTDLVMNAARAAGARGGTVLHGKGTGGEQTQKFYNVSIAREKEVILIVASADNKSDIMRAILQKAGPDSQAGTIVFSLPTSEVAGFGLMGQQ